MVIHDEHDSKITNCKIMQPNAYTNRSNIGLFITDIIDVECHELHIVWAIKQYVINNITLTQ